MKTKMERLYRKIGNYSDKDRQKLKKSDHENHKAVEFYMSAIAAQSYMKGVVAGNKQSPKVLPHQNFELVVNNLCEKYPLITVDNDVLGEPRLSGTRFAVSNVLTAFTNSNSVEEIIDEYEDRYTEKQLKDALRFARDFLDSFYTS